MWVRGDYDKWFLTSQHEVSYLTLREAAANFLEHVGESCYTLRGATFLNCGVIGICVLVLFLLGSAFLVIKPFSYFPITSRCANLSDLRCCLTATVQVSLTPE